MLMPHSFVITFPEVIKRDWMFKLVGKETFFMWWYKYKGHYNIDAVRALHMNTLSRLTDRA